MNYPAIKLSKPAEELGLVYSLGRLPTPKHEVDYSRFLHRFSGTDTGILGVDFDGHVVMDGWTWIAEYYWFQEYGLAILSRRTTRVEGAGVFSISNPNKPKETIGKMLRFFILGDSKWT